MWKFWGCKYKMKLKFPTLRKIKADEECFSEACIEVYLTYNLDHEKSPPYDHRVNTGLIETTIRRMKELATLAFTLLETYVHNETITVKEATKLWYRVVQYARWVMLLYPSYNNETVTRFEWGYGCKPDFSTLVMMPFATTIVSKTPNAGYSRGSMALYLGPSNTVKGGVVAFNMVSIWSYSNKAGQIIFYRSLLSSRLLFNFGWIIYRIRRVDSSIQCQRRRSSHSQRPQNRPWLWWINGTITRSTLPCWLYHGWTGGTCWKGSSLQRRSGLCMESSSSIAATRSCFDDAKIPTWALFIAFSERTHKFLYNCIIT